MRGQFSDGGRGEQNLAPRASSTPQSIHLDGLEPPFVCHTTDKIVALRAPPSWTVSSKEFRRY